MRKSILLNTLFPISVFAASIINPCVSAYASPMQGQENASQYISKNEKLSAAENKLNTSIQKSAFEQVKSQEFPLTPNQIRNVRMTRQNVQEETYQPLYKVKQETKTYNLNVTSPVVQTINLVPNYATIVSFYDASGAPWTIKKIFINSSLGITSEIIGPKENQIILAASNSYAQGDMIVTLKGFNNAISVNINANQKVSDRRISFTLSQLSPASMKNDASSQTMQNTSHETLMLNLLAGTVPNNAEPLTIHGNIHASAWKIDKSIYIRTQAQLISPAWNDQKSEAGLTVYRLPAGNTQFIFSENGLDENVSISPAKGASQS